MNGLPVAVVGVPLMVMILFDHDAVTPAGRPVGVPIPVAPVVVWVMSVMAVLIQAVAAPGPVTELTAVTVIVPVALTVPQPPVNGML